VIAAVLRTSLRFRMLVVAVAIGVIAAGILQLRDAPVDVLPEFAPPYVEVQTEALGLSAEEVEQLVTVPLEADLLNGTKGVTVLRSQSVPGASSIVLVFEPGTDISEARQLVQEQLTQAHANPNVSQPPQMLQPLSSESRVMLTGLSPKSMSAIEASVLARWTIRPRLLGVDGVANVSIFGARDRQLQVLVDPERLRDDGVTLRQVIATAGNAQLVSPLSFLEASTPGTGGFIDTANQRLQVRHILPSVTPAQLGRVPVEGGEGAAAPRRDGKPLQLGAVTRVVEDHQPLIGDAVVQDGAGILLVVEKFPGSDTRAVTRGVEEALDGLRPGLSGLALDTSAFRPADYIGEALHNLTAAIVAGCVLLVLVLLALLLSWRTTLICVTAFAVSLTAAALVLYTTGASFNALVFAGLAAAVGVVVDDAVIDVHNIRRRLGGPGAGRDGPAAHTLLGAAAAEMRAPIGYATAIVALTALPMLFLEGVGGSFFAPIVRSYLLAVAASMVVALTLTPALSMMLLARRSGAGRESPLLRWTGARYGAALSRIIGRPYAALVAAGLVVLLGLALVPALDGPLIPSFRDRNLVVHLDGPPGTSQPEMSRIIARASRELRAVPGVAQVAGHVGRAVTGDQVVDVNASELWVRLDRNADYARTRDAVQRVVDGYTGLRRSLLTYERQRIHDIGAVDDRQAGTLAGGDLDALTGADRRPLVVRVFGEDLGVLRREAEHMQQLLSKVDGVVDPRVERLVQEPTMAIEVDLARAQRYGVKPGDVRRAAATLLSGIQVGSLFEEQKVFEVVVRATPGARRSLSDVRRLLIDTPAGGHVRLGQIAEVRVRPTPQVIQRDASSRRIDVSARVSGRGIADVERDVKRQLARIGFPLEYHAEVIADATGPRFDALALAGVALAAAIGILLLLQAALRSWRLAAAAILTLPVALVGAELAGLVAGGAFSLGSLIGLFTVLGIAARQVVVLLVRCRQLQHGEGETFGPALAMRGAHERLAPILTTTAATAVALAPFALLGDRAGYEIVHPLAVAVLGGLVTSALASLLLLPVLYARLGGGPPPEPELVLQRLGGLEPEPQGAAVEGNGARAPAPEPVGADVNSGEGK